MPRTKNCPGFGLHMYFPSRSISFLLSSSLLEQAKVIIGTYATGAVEKGGKPCFIPLLGPNYVLHIAANKCLYLLNYVLQKHLSFDFPQDETAALFHWGNSFRPSQAKYINFIPYLHHSLA
jgi:hypothetical protein